DGEGVLEYWSDGVVGSRCSGAGITQHSNTPSLQYSRPLGPVVLDLLASLVEKSLVGYEERGGAARYRLLETIRHYALERLEKTGEGNSVRRRHRAFYLALAEEAEPLLAGAQQAAWLERLETEHDNLRAALGDCEMDAEESVEDGLRLAGALSR